MIHKEKSAKIIHASQSEYENIIGKPNFLLKWQNGASSVGDKINFVENYQAPS